MADIELKGSGEEHAGQVQPKETPDETREKALVQEVVDHFALVMSVESEQRHQEDEDLEFESGDQWLDTHRASRSERIDEVTGQKTPARPMLTINLVDQPVQQTLNEARQARLSVTVKPKAGVATTETAGYYKGLIRSIQADCGAQEARMWALERATKCGRGAYEVRTEFANDGDFDLDIVIDRILDQGTVYWDPYSRRADRADAEWCLIAEWMSESERVRRWPSKPLRPTEDAFVGADHPWFALDDKDQKSVRVVRYYKVSYDTKVLAYHPQHGTAFLDEMPEEIRSEVLSKAPGVRTREPDTREGARQITLYYLDGSQILETHQWMGRYIPVIAVTGKEYNIKGKRKWKGVVTNMKDLGRGYNVAISSAVELVGSMPRAPYIMAAGADAGFEDMWDDSAIKNYTRLYYNTVLVDGKPAPPPQRQTIEPQIQSVMFLARVLRDDSASMVGTVDPSTRAVRPYDRSGKAIEALQRQGAAGSSNYLDNLATISMMYEGRILVNLIPKVYDRPGRIIRVMGEENDDETAIMLKVPFIYDEDQVPTPVPCPACQGTGGLVLQFGGLPTTCPACQGIRMATKEQMPKTWKGKPVKYVDLGEGEFKVSVSIGRSYQTKQEEALAGMTELATAAPPLVPLYADLWVRAMGFSGSTEIADRIQKQNPAAAKDGEEDAQTPEIPPEFLQQVQQLKMEHDQAMMELQKATAALQADTVKMEGQKQLQAMKTEAQLGLEHLKQQHEVMTLALEQKASKEIEVIKGDLEQMRLESEQRHEVLLQVLKAKAATALEAHRAALAPPVETKGAASPGASE